MLKKISENRIQISLIVATVLFTILRFLLNEKGRVNPDSIRYMRQAEIFPIIDNTTAPLGYPLMIKLISYFGTDGFWASKIIGIFAYLFIVIFAWKKKFYFKETVLLGTLFSFVSVFSFTMSEAFILPFVYLLLYFGDKIINMTYKNWKAIFLLCFFLIALYNIRYSSLFIMAACVIFGIYYYKKIFGKLFIISGVLGVLFMVFYQLTFVQYFNEEYYNQFLEIGLHSTSKLLIELFQGLCTTFNPFIHISNPNGGIINIGIYSVGFINIIVIVFLLLRKKLYPSEVFFLCIGISGIVCSYFIQYFYSVNPIDYRLMAPFSFPIWLLYFKKLYEIIGKYTYGISVISFAIGFLFTILSKGNYLENRKKMKDFLVKEELIDLPLKFYMVEEKDLSSMQLAELISTINPVIYVTFQPKDSLQKNTLTRYKIIKKIKIDENKYQ